MTRIRQSAVGGAVCLIVCAILTALCAIAAELQNHEPALRGLVHAGVMLLFAGICIEPLLRNSDTVQRSSLEDAQGMGIFFAGMGMMQLISVGIDGLFRKLLHESYNWWPSKFFSAAGCLVVGWFLVQPVLLPQEPEEQFFFGRLKNLITLGLFALATLASLFNTIHLIAEVETSHYVLVLDLMAYVFHRAFIGTLLVGAGFGTSQAIVATTARSNLRCRYRAFFSIVCINLSVSWRRHSVSSIGVLLAGLLQFDEAIAFVKLISQTSTWQWYLPRNPISGCQWLLPTTSGNQFAGNAYVPAVLSFAFYSGTLYVDGVLLHSSPGLDECLVKAVHVAAVLSAMVAIFPRLLLPFGSYERVVHNAIVKTVCASMSTMDVIVCTWKLWQDQTSTFFSSTMQRTVLYLRCLGAILEAVTFAVLQVKPSDHPGALATEDAIPLTHPPSHARAGGGGVDGAAMVTWIIYFGTHVYHSCVDPIGRDAIAMELQLSKIFHFQVITIGFYTSGILRKDPMSTTVVSVFAFYEILGVVACGQSLSNLSLDRWGMVVGSLLMLVDCLSRLIHHDPNSTSVAREKKEEGAGAVLFPS